MPPAQTSVLRTPHDYGFHNLERRIITLVDGTVYFYFTIPSDQLAETYSDIFFSQAPTPLPAILGHDPTSSIALPHVPPPTVVTPPISAPSQAPVVPTPLTLILPAIALPLTQWFASKFCKFLVAAPSFYFSADVQRGIHHDASILLRHESPSTHFSASHFTANEFSTPTERKSFQAHPWDPGGYE